MENTQEDACTWVRLSAASARSSRARLLTYDDELHLPCQARKLTFRLVFGIHFLSYQRLGLMRYPVLEMHILRLPAILLCAASPFAFQYSQTGQLGEALSVDAVWLDVPGYGRHHTKFSVGRRLE